MPQSSTETSAEPMSGQDASGTLLDRMPADVPGLWEGYRDWLAERGVEHPRVVLHGGYGKRNMGDDAILHVLLGRVRRELPGARVTVVCHGPDWVAERYPEVAACHFKSLGALKAMLASHIYIIGGGGIINRINTYSGRRVLKVLDMKGKFQFLATLVAGVTGARTHYYAIGATSFPDPAVRLLASAALRRADTVSVRDPLSEDNVRRLGVRGAVLVRDPALSLVPAPVAAARAILADVGLRPKGERDRPLVGLNLRYVGDPAIDNDATVALGAELVERLTVEHGCGVLFLAISRHPSKELEADHRFADALRAALPDTVPLHRLDRYHPPEVMAALIGELDYLLVSRLHGAILAHVVGTPFRCISYDHKVEQFAKLSQPGDPVLRLGECDAGAVLDAFVSGVRGPGSAQEGARRT
jgi:polysaccharide pyruvyl transferase WcaK-like protein